jgi:hypothetical protein
MRTGRSILGVLPAVLIAAAVLPSPANAQATAQASPSPFEARTVADLATLCGTPPGTANYAAAIAFCHGFLQGAGQYHAAITQPGSGRRPLFCAPNPPPTRAQVANAFVAWAQANPANAGERAVDGLVRWASTAYPCPEPNRGTPARTR